MLNDFINQWFKMFHLSIPIPKCLEGNETIPPFPDFAMTSDGFEIMSLADAALKGKVIEHMGKVCA